VVRTADPTLRQVGDGNSVTAESLIVVSGKTASVRRKLRPVEWMVLEEVALSAVNEGGRLLSRISARQVAERLGVDPGTAAGALRTLRNRGLVVLEREQGAAGRFGLSIYLLGAVSGLTVVSRVPRSQVWSSLPRTRQRQTAPVWPNQTSRRSLRHRAWIDRTGMHHARPRRTWNSRAWTYPLRSMRRRSSSHARSP
jgi:hypothetical protein